MTVGNIRNPIFWIASLFLSLCWLLPNKSDPWRGFHSEFLAAISTSVLAILVLIEGRSKLNIEGFQYLILLLLPIPFVHFYFGMVPFSGIAWTSSAYILAFFLALLIGGEWGERNLMQLGDCIFSAVLIAAIVSVGLQMQQWLGTGQDAALDVWISSQANGRPSANMGQPNHLATLLLWAIIAAWWWKWRGFIGPRILVAVTFFLSFGLVLTRSRSGILGFGVLIVLLCVWPPLQKAWSTKREARACALKMFFAFCFSFFAAKAMADCLALSTMPSLSDRMASDSRPIVWRMFLHALWERPWFGFGWNSTFSAQLAEAEKYPEFKVAFFYSHYLFLDIFLWIGVPLGVAIVLLFMKWLLTMLRNAESPFQAMGISMTLVIGIHAMVEYPLYYAYFLLPLGIVMGAVNSVILKNKTVSYAIKIERKFVIIALALGVGWLFLIAKDYLSVEEMSLSLQLEDSGIREVGSSRLSDVRMLNQFKELYDFRKLKPQEGMSPESIRRAEEILKLSPSPRNFVILAQIYALNNRSAAAKSTLLKMCKIIPKDQCEIASKKWEIFQQANPILKNIDWSVGK
ncbi:O-antigen ligase family protein [Variovorax sp.]|uniref:PglL family O-oligosaccharyltransferase n=1 Tax=Variovorax sp. TaxID=1871043 RepID=UPI00137FF124|nr:O-antigen ligase family protein [Variovorax sp.]KAF1061359.1 MAG: hypothetical protein GAK39_05747 [Variovorax sp.]